ncbi:MFS transporter [Rhodovulum sp. DZ06]|uniref:MFS transporter n=1 Tax=Rhodovulum sp. DZ06 TaxID=3425126 RepID=UPI003D34AF0D
MLSILSNAWALLLGMLLLMLGNGLQGTLLGVRGAIEGFDPAGLSWVMSAYFLGLLIGSRSAPRLIKRVGHVRVFAALASIISAAFILYAAAPDLVAWAVMRLIVGFCFAGVYVVTESWLNDTATNETRGQALSVYMMVSMAGLVLAQVVLTLADPGGFTLFIVISVVVSLSFAPILLSVSPAPVYETASPMTLRRLYRASPLGAVGQLLLGAGASAVFAMSAVYGSQQGLSVEEISLFVALVYIGGFVFQAPIGWLSDRMDRRLLIIASSGLGAAAAAAAFVAQGEGMLVFAAALLIGGTFNPLYSLLIAHANDFLPPEDMAAASGGMLFLNGLGSVGGPVIAGALMQAFGAPAFFAYLAATLTALCSYALWRSTRRASVAVEDQAAYAAVMPSASPVAVEVAQEVAIEQILAAEEEEAAEEEAAEEAAAEGAGAAKGSGAAQ